MIFLRFSGCNLTCSWCDTYHDPGEKKTKEEIYTIIKNLLADGGVEPRLFHTIPICFTGGEPAAQVNTKLLK